MKHVMCLCFTFCVKYFGKLYHLEHESHCSSAELGVPGLSVEVRADETGMHGVCAHRFVSCCQSFVEHFGEHNLARFRL